MAGAGKDAGQRRSAPYVGFATYKNMIGGLHDNIIPSRIDRSVLGKFSGIVGSQLLATLRFFDQIDADGRPKENLEPLVIAYGTESWSQALADQLKRAYSPIFTLDLKTASPGEFTETFRAAYPAEGDTLRKALTFFLNAAGDAQIPINTYITKNKKPRSVTPRKPKPAKNNGIVTEKKTDLKPDDDGTEVEAFQRDLLEKFPSFDPAWPDPIKAEWFKGFDQFMQMAKKK